MKVNISEYLNIEFFFVCIQLLSATCIVFLHASGMQFPFSLILFANSCIYVFLYRRRLRYFNSAIGISFSLLAIVTNISYCNYFYYDEFSGFMFHNASLFEVYTFSLVWFVNFVFFYVYALGNRNLNILILFSWMFFLVSIYANIRAYNYRALLGTEVQYHYYYYFLIIIPLLIWSTNNGKIKYAFIFVALIATIFSFKRTGVFVSCALILINLLYDFRSSSWKGIIGISFLLVALVIIGYYISPKLEGQITRMLVRLENIQNDGGSLRQDYVNNVYYEFVKEPFENKIIGNGYWSMYIKENHFIDVEWASMLYYYGLFGLSAYFMFHVAMLFRIRFFLKKKHAGAISLINCYVIFLLYSMASELFAYQYLSVPLFIYIGMMEGLTTKNKINEQN